MMMLGMDCLVRNFGIINSELFISSVRGTCSDYTLWRRRIFDDMSDEEFDELLRSSVKDYPFEG
jgi:hypothetical protein